MDGNFQVTFYSAAQKVTVRKEDIPMSASQTFKEEVKKLAKNKRPGEMTLIEYREYLMEKIQKLAIPFMGADVRMSLNISDMALVELKSDPKLEEEVLRGIRYTLAKETKKGLLLEEMELNVRLFHVKETRVEKDEDEQVIKRRILRKKMIEIWFEQRAYQREQYTEFLETGRRYATPCPAVEMLRAMQAMGGFLGL